MLIPTVDRLFEPQLIGEFIMFISWGTLPNGKTTTLERPKDDELRFLGTQDPNRPGENCWFGERIQACIVSDPDGSRLCDVPKNLHALKNRLFSGIVPLSEQRWKEKGLDQSKNFDVAAQYLSAVVATFEYLNQPRVAQNMRETFNLISEILGEVQTVVNGFRRGRGETLIDLRALWAVFIEATFEVMTECAHRWVIAHVNRLRAPLLRKLASHRPANTNVYDSEQWRITDRLHVLAEIAGVADFTVMLSMDGYYGYTTPPVPAGVPPALRSPDWETRRKTYSPYLKTACRVQQAKEIADIRTRGERRLGMADPVDLIQTSMLQINCQAQVRREMRGDPIEPVPKEPWISHESRRMEQFQEKGCGYVIYRLTYGQSEEEWSAFREKLEAHILDWGTGQTGSATMKPHLKLHWRDGKELGIVENDLEAAKKHYNSTYTESQSEVPFTLREIINKRAFLAVDCASYTSYTGSAFSAATDFVLKGDFTGFVVAVHADYDPKEGPYRPEECPAYPGQMRILGSLIWGDLYAMHSAQCAILEDLWPLALEHPNQVYVGPLVPLVVKGWRTQSGIRGTLMRDMASYVKANLEGTQWAGPTVPPLAQFELQQPAPNFRAELPGEPPLAPPNLARTDPFNYALRQWMLRDFARYTRRRGAPRQAIMAEQLLRTAPGEMPDMNAIRRRMEEEGVLHRPDALPPSLRAASGQEPEGDLFDDDYDSDENPDCPVQ
ncbi:hypothetical protein BJY04DRAFT_186751 [Aspergillus karnatakaensis]|uniref:uncharacterized protein n=1 Tax=Aspergillus karnatakaensis TaxID=1810916 RepID=UPI003CCD74FD